MATTNAQTFTIGGVTHQVEDTTARAGVSALQTALASLQSALDTLMGTDDITDEIDTYNEIKEFLDGFDTDDPNLSEQLTTLFTNVNDLVAAMPNKASATQVNNLQTAVTNLQTALAGKVDAVNGKGLSTNDFTTALLNKLNGIAPGAQVNVITGIKAHGASTNLPVTNGVVELPKQTEVDPDDYYDKDEVDELIENIPAGPQGPKGDTVVVDTEGLEQFDLANTLNSTSTTDGLTARQGKILKQAIMTVAANLQAVYNALAGVAFVSLPKPAQTPIDWTGGTFYVPISKSLTGVTDTNDSVQVAENASYTNTLTPQSGLTMRSVVVTMGGVDITSTAYTAATGVIYIAQVTGPVVITAVAEEVGKVNVSKTLRNMVLVSDNTDANGKITEGSTYTATLETAPMVTEEIAGYNPSTLPLYGNNIVGIWSAPTVVVKKGGVEVVGAYNASTGVITVNNVDDDIEVIAITEPKVFQDTYPAKNSTTNEIYAEAYTTRPFGINSIFAHIPNGCTKIRWYHAAHETDSFYDSKTCRIFRPTPFGSSDVRWATMLSEPTIGGQGGQKFPYNYVDISFTAPSAEWQDFVYMMALFNQNKLGDCFLVDITNVDSSALAAADAAAATAAGESGTQIVSASLDAIVDLGGNIIFDGRYSELTTLPSE